MNKIKFILLCLLLVSCSKNIDSISADEIVASLIGETINKQKITSLEQIKNFTILSKANVSDIVECKVEFKNVGIKKEKIFYYGKQGFYQVCLLTYRKENKEWKLIYTNYIETHYKDAIGRKTKYINPM